MAKNIKIIQLQISLSDATLVNSVLINSNLKFEILQVNTKEKLYEAIDVFSPDIILTDEVITFETGPSIPFIIFADYVSAEFEASVFLNGAADYIYKDRPYRLVKAIQTIARDATEKKQMKQAFEFEKRRFNELFLQATTSMGIFMGPDHVFEMANPLYMRLIGRKDVVGKSLREVLPGVEHQGFHELLDEVYQTGKSISANEMLATVFDEDSGKQKNIFINLSYQAYRNPEGKVIGIFFFIVEVTNEVEARKKIEESEARYRQIAEDLKKYTRELVISNKDLEQFSYIISHNLRSPVANIIGLVEELKDDEHSPEVKQMLRDSLSVSVNLLDNTIIDLNMILKVKNEINENKERVNFLELISNIHLSLEKLFHNAQVTIQTDFNEINEMFTLKSYMQSIFFNLITNSVKYRRPDVSPLIVIRSECADNKLILTFKDNGLGMDLNNKDDEIFGLYKRFHDHVEGKGMGLFMVKTQVETLGGKITIDSEVNKGTAFKLVFPLN